MVFILRYWPRSLPGAFISCLDKKRTKEATGGRGAEQISYRKSLLFGTFHPGNNHPLPPDPLSRRSALVVCFFLIDFYVALRRNFKSVPLGAHIHALRMQGASCRRRITTHDSGLHLAHHRWVHHSLRRSDKLRFVLEA